MLADDPAAQLQMLLSGRAGNTDEVDEDGDAIGALPNVFPGATGRRKLGAAGSEAGSTPTSQAGHGGRSRRASANIGLWAPGGASGSRTPGRGSMFGGSVSGRSSVRGGGAAASVTGSGGRSVTGSAAAGGPGAIDLRAERLASMLTSLGGQRQVIGPLSTLQASKARVIAAESRGDAYKKQMAAQLQQPPSRESTGSGSAQADGGTELMSPTPMSRMDT